MYCFRPLLRGKAQHFMYKIYYVKPSKDCFFKCYDQVQKESAAYLEALILYNVHSNIKHFFRELMPVLTSQSRIKFAYRLIDLLANAIKSYRKSVERYRTFLFFKSQGTKSCVSTSVKINATHEVTSCVGLIWWGL